MVTINHCRSKDTPTTSRCTNQAHREISLISAANSSFFPWLSGLLFVDFFFNFCTKCKINSIKFSKYFFKVTYCKIRQLWTWFRMRCTTCVRLNEIQCTPCLSPCFYTLIYWIFLFFLTFYTKLKLWMCMYSRQLPNASGCWKYLHFFRAVDRTESAVWSPAVLKSEGNGFSFWGK